MASIGNHYLDERYEALKLINTGGTSKVFLVSDKNLNTQWAIKKVKKDAEAVSTIMTEVNVLKSLRHPALPRIIDIREDEEFFYIVMDYIPGENLRTVLRTSGPQEQDTVVSWAISLCDAISYLHKHGIIYRDMKPSNVMLTPDGDIKLIDFGIARNYDPNLSEDTVSLGTEGYAAPEQYEGFGQSDARTDVFGIGITMFQLLTDINPVTHRKNTFSIRLARPELSSGLDKVILKATNKDRELRYQTAEELKQALLHYHDLDNETVRKKNKKKARVSIFVILSLVCFALSGASFFLNRQQIDNRYQALVSDSQNAKHIEEAINLKPQESEGYIALLNSYGEEFDQNEASDFSHVFAEHQNEIKNKDEVAMAAGEKMLSSYTEESLRGKLFAAEPYFSAVSKEYERYAAANAYVKLASFYRDFVMQGEGSIVREANKKDYAELLKNMNEVIASVSKYKGAEQKNLLLTVSDLCLGIISEQTYGMKEQKIAKQDILSVVDQIEAKVGSINSSVEVVSTKQKDVLKTIKDTKKNINTIYAERSEDA